MITQKPLWRKIQWFRFLGSDFQLTGLCVLAAHDRGSFLGRQVPSAAAQTDGSHEPPCDGLASTAPAGRSALNNLCFKSII